MNDLNCFFAYPSRPPRLAEILETAMRRIRADDIVGVVGWKELRVAGKVLILDICRAIDDADVFVCDLTNLNENVLFEYGFAIAKNKKTWVVRDPTIEPSQKDFERFQLLTTIGYREFHNHEDILRQFYDDKPYDDLSNTTLRQVRRSRKLSPPEAPLLYLKCPIITEASRSITKELQRSTASAALHVVVDDPHEEVARSLQWYATYAEHSHAVLAHFVEQDRLDARFHNAKAAFVSGLSVGFGCSLLMIATRPYETPIDYRDLMQIRGTAKQCKAAVTEWLDEVKLQTRKRRRSERIFEDTQRRSQELRALTLGDPIAENEEHMLPEYFIETASCRDALAAGYLFLVGRRGCGKTALAYHLRGVLGRSREKHVCLVQPLDYDLQGVLEVFGRIAKDYDFGATADSFWRILVYTELARSLQSELLALPPGALTQVERDFLKALSPWDDLLAVDFTERLEHFVARLARLQETSETDRIDIRHALFSNIIPELREHLRSALANRTKVTILVDNLDKAWKPEAYGALLRELLLGFMRVSGKMIGEFGRRDYRGRRIPLSVLVFLRSDIFVGFLDSAREKDKVPMKRMAWDDRDMLMRVISERFAASAQGSTGSANEIWERHFCPDVRGQPVRDFLYTNVFPRPRDLISFVGFALDRAIDRGHDRICEEDLLDACHDYSRLVFQSAIDEGQTRLDEVGDLLLGFLGAEEVVTTAKIRSAMLDAGVPESKLDDVIDLLCDLTFLGREVREGEFEFVWDYRDRDLVRAKAKGFRREANRQSRYRINVHFSSYLGIKPA